MRSLQEEILTVFLSVIIFPRNYGSKKGFGVSIGQNLGSITEKPTFRAGFSVHSLYVHYRKVSIPGPRYFDRKCIELNGDSDRF